MTRFAPALLGFFLLSAASALAQPTPPRPPAPPSLPAPPSPPAFSADALDAMFLRPPRVEVNLRGPILRLAAAATADDPETAAMMRGLRGVTVRVYSLDAARNDLGRMLSQLGDSFGREGWDPLVRVRGGGDGSEDVWVYVRAGATLFEGLAVAAVDSEDGTVSFVHIDGLIDPAQIGALGSRFGGVDVDGLRNDASEDRERAREDAQRAREEGARAREEGVRAREEGARAREEAQRARQEALAEAERAREDARRAREDARAEAARARAEAEAARKDTRRP